ncbi:MAG: carbohydrate ABC transporter permease [Treponema sp.]|jgi:raffinose/stachyose/melibiose transport system permease protein|nr:carbohydrate ABC transporter permease [Treponema sp.]
MNLKNISPIKIIVHLFLFAVVIFQLFPLVVLFINTLRTDVEIKKMPIGFPNLPSLANYPVTWERGGYLIAFRNSFFVGFCVIVIVLVLAGLGAYGLARLKMPGKSFFMGYFMLGMSFPSFMFIVPLYYNFSKLGLVNNHLSLIIIYSASYLSFSILLIRTFLVSIPRELEEAGKIDGCSELRVFVHITLPLVVPIMTTVALVAFVWSWNEFLWANTFLTTDTFRTVSTRFYKFTSEYSRDMAKIYTAGMITLGPIIVLYLFLQKSFIEGLTQGAIKG